MRGQVLLSRRKHIDPFARAHAGGDPRLNNWVKGDAQCEESMTGIGDGKNGRGVKTWALHNLAALSRIESNACAQAMRERGQGRCQNLGKVCKKGQDRKTSCTIMVSDGRVSLAWSSLTSFFSASAPHAAR